jgi:hypothetical protein
MAQTYTSHGTDIAIFLRSDITINPGMVVEFGGNYDIQPCDTAGSKRVAGVASEFPGYVMNSVDSDAIPRVLVAIAGKTKCQVFGPCEKGDLLIATGGSYAVVSANPQAGQIIGKAMERKTTVGAGVIDIMVTLG